MTHVGIDPQHPAALHAHFHLDLAWVVEPPGRWHATVLEGAQTFHFSSPLSFLEWLEDRTSPRTEISMDLP